MTSDGGAHWTQTFTNTEPGAFYDCMTFFDRHRGLALSDPPNGKFRLIATNDGGMTWQVVSQAGMPPALPGEAAFAASGQCLTSQHGHHAWFGSGGGAQARVFRSKDGGNDLAGERDADEQRPDGGNLRARVPRHEARHRRRRRLPPPRRLRRTRRAVTSDGGKTWTLAERAERVPLGRHVRERSHRDRRRPRRGSDVSTDDGKTWTTFDDGSFDTVDCAGGEHCWASGAQGRVAYLVKSH